MALALRQHGLDAYALRGGFDAWRGPTVPRAGRFVPIQPVV